MTTDLTISELAESLTGFDELAITKAFGAPVTATMPDEDSGYRGDQMMFARQLVFVAERRAGKKDPQAYAAAMELTAREVGDYFADDPEEIDPKDPETPEGKDD